MPEYKLNQTQEEAVQYTKGPLLIVAGAGTGKTTVITNKICHLIKNGLAKPEEILALTFTDKAALEMQDRVDRMVNVGYTEMQISTFHAFCQKILERHAMDIGLGNHFKLLTETAAWLLVRKNFHKFALDYYRPLGNPIRHIRELLKHFSKCKDELITPQEYLEYAESLKLNCDSPFTAPNPLAEGAGGGVTEVARLIEIANAYHVYNHLLLDSAMLDFGDLIFYVNKLFVERPIILQIFRDKYKYILVDEFQDVNWAQYKLICLLVDQKSQLTVVGDDDQSIYAFRGASVSNILRFKDDFPQAKEIVLNENYRSSKKILDTAYKLIQQNNPDRLEIKLNINKKLKAKNSDSKSEVVHFHASNLEEEVRLVINEIKRLKKTDESAVWDDFAILVRANNHAEPFINQLEAGGIPYEFLASSGLYRQPVILDCLNYFKLLDNYHESSAIYRLLCLPFLNFKENDLQKLTSFGKKKTISYYETLKRATEVGLSEEGLSIGNRLIELLHEGLKRMRFEKPSVILYGFLEKIGYLNYLAQEETQGNREVIRQIYHLKQFFEYLSEFEIINPDARVAGFLEHFNMILESGDKGVIFQPAETPDSVNILTVHAAKGLEFKYVFIVNLVEDRFPSRNKGDGIEIPKELIKEQLPEGDSHYQEERRLFYVAITRAKERVYFTSANDYGGVRTKKLSRFLAELEFFVKEGGGSARQSLPEKKSHAAQRGQFIYDLPNVFSFSQIRSYETCPYQYKLAHILKIPTGGNASFSFGQTMHAALHEFYGQIQELNKTQQSSLFAAHSENEKQKVIRVPGLDDLMAIYEKHWIPDWYKSQHQREEYCQKGKEILKTFYKLEDGNWTVPLSLESWFKIKVGDYLIHGRIDRIDRLSDGTLEIIDYKTGKSKVKLASEDKEQLLIYQIALEELLEYKNIGAPAKLTFLYLNNGLKISFLGKNKELLELKQKLIETIDKIYLKNFTATPSRFACDNCDFQNICNFRL